MVEVSEFPNFVEESIQKQDEERAIFLSQKFSSQLNIVW